MSHQGIAAVRAPATNVGMRTTRMSRTRIGSALLALGLAAAPAAQATTWVVMTNAEIGAADALDKNTCNAANHQCPTLREAITAAQSGDWVMFDPSLDGKVITLTRYTNCLAASQAKGPTCLPLNSWPTVPGSSPAVPYVSQFGASAFFISGKTITIDATQTPNLLAPMKHGIVMARDLNAPNFRLFDIDGTNDGLGNATSVLYLFGLTFNGGVAQGGDGGSGLAGGALGAGGAIFNRGDMQIGKCSFVVNAANGGSSGSVAQYTGGGGAGQSSDASGDGGGANGGKLNGSGVAGFNGGFGGGGSSSNSNNQSNGGFGGGGGAGGVGITNGGFGGGGGYGLNGGFGGGSGVGNAPLGGGGGGAMGGAIFNDGGTLKIYDSTFSANTVKGGDNHVGSGYGGASYGGAIFNYNGNLTLNDVTLTGNVVTQSAGNLAGHGGKIAAGAIYSLGDSQAACSAGGNVSCTTAGATLTMDNSIAAKNIGASNDIVVNLLNSGTSAASGANNFIGASLAPFTLTQINTAAVTDPQLGTLPVQLSGGLADVLVPQPASPVIDAELCTSAHSDDQRGVSRQQGAKCDVGAVEVRQNVTLGVNVYGAGAVNAVVPPATISGGIVNCTSSGGLNCVAVYPNSEAQPFIASVTLNVAQGQHWTSASNSGCVFSNASSLDGSSVVFTIPAHQCGMSLALAPNTTTTAVTSSANPSIVNDPVTFTATVNPASPSTLLPSGTVTFYDGPNAICTNATLAATGPSTAQATCTVSNLAVGSHPISAQYHGDGNYPAANQPESAVLTQQIVKPTLTITANNLTKTYGQTLTFDGTEFTASGLRNGDTVTSVTLASAGAIASAPVAGSPYTIAVPNITGGSYNPANYDVVFVTGKLTVTAAPQSLTFPAPARAIVGAALPFSVTSATPNSGSPVSVASATLAVCTVATTSNTATGTAGTVTALSVGTCTIVASQAADAAGNYAPASAQAAFAVNLPPSPAPALSWRMLILLATVCAGAACARLPKISSSTR